MYALSVQNLPEGKEWLYEVKFDGYRCLAGRDSTAVTLWSRRENLFTTQFPHIAQACERFPPGTLLDGEIVPWMKADGSRSIISNTIAPRAGVALLRIRRARMPWPKPVERAAVRKAGNPE
jgi:hypothetical protein